jgi:hypothetical protein
MKSSMNYDLYQQLEFGVEQQRKQESGWVYKFNQLWQNVLLFLSTAPEPRVWKMCNEAGEVYWNADDPITGERVQRLTETEMRAWLEDRHYNYHAAA